MFSLLFFAFLGLLNLLLQLRPLLLAFILLHSLLLQLALALQALDVQLIQLSSSQAQLFPSFFKLPVQSDYLFLESLLHLSVGRLTGLFAFDQLVAEFL